ncbi:MAG TPA: hypothetical protein PKC18_10925, partial [Lacipirellulaceae bacterium]|nr:hypothetical protein [Lacipirellulaceae bacterium]
MRKKLLFVAAVALGLAALLAFSFDFNVAAGPQTTVITAPLAEDGLPNYAQAIVERQREGVTEENNGARLFWQAIGQEDVSPEDFALLCREIGVAIDPTAPTLTDVRGTATMQRVDDWLADERNRRRPAALEADNDNATEDANFNVNAAAVALITAACRMPWTADEIPPLAAWVAENEGPIDLLVAAAAKERFFSPSPSVLADPRTLVIQMLPPNIDSIRSAGYALAARAMHRAGQGRYADAWDDCLACWRFGEHMADGPSLIDRLLAIALRGLARDATLALLQAEDAPEAVLRQILDDLSSLAPSVGMAEAIDRGERFQSLDWTLRMVAGRLGGVPDDWADALSTVAFQAFGKLNLLALDVNVVLRMNNAWYDRYAAAAALNDFAARRRELSRLDAEWKAHEADRRGRLFVGTLSPRRAISEKIGWGMVSPLFPPIDVAVRAQDRDAANMALVRIAAALALHRAATGQYPATLDELVPATLAGVPLDPYRNEPPAYERRGDGYLLYSVFE